MHNGYSKNKHGVVVSEHTCEACKREFSVTPAVYPEQKGWDNCMGPDCPSYDADRDVDAMLDAGALLVPGAPVGVA